MNAVKKGLQEADKKARIRDLDIQTDENQINNLAEQAEKLGLGLYQKKDTNQATFTQVISENIEEVVRKGYLTMNELGFLMSIQPLIEYQINAIMNKERNTFMTISDIAKYVGGTRSNISRVIKTLLDKGIIFEFVNAKELKEFNRSVSSRTLFVNPELFYAGDKNKIDGTLATLVSEYDSIEKDGVKLKWKVLRRQGHTFGKLYTRKTYLEHKKGK